MNVRGLPHARDVLLVGAGGAVGAVARVAFATVFPSGVFPWGTFVENVLGAFLLGLLLTVLLEHSEAAPATRLLVCTGALGAFTTYSTFANELGELLRGGDAGVAVAYAAGSLVAGIVAAVAGVRIALVWARR
jgi:fluoride exporter